MTVPEFPAALVEKAAQEAFWSDDISGHHKASPFNYSPYEWETIPEAGRENYRRLVRAILSAVAPDLAEERERIAAAIEMTPAEQWGVDLAVGSTPHQGFYNGANAAITFAARVAREGGVA